jgi:hypothetical protein
MTFEARSLPEVTSTIRSVPPVGATPFVPETVAVIVTGRPARLSAPGLSPSDVEESIEIVEKDGTTKSTGVAWLESQPFIPVKSNVAVHGPGGRRIP